MKKNSTNMPSNEEDEVLSVASDSTSFSSLPENDFHLPLERENSTKHFQPSTYNFPSTPSTVSSDEAGVFSSTDEEDEKVQNSISLFSHKQEKSLPEPDQHSKSKYLETQDDDKKEVIMKNNMDKECINAFDGDLDEAIVETENDNNKKCHSDKGETRIPQENICDRETEIIAPENGSDSEEVYNGGVNDDESVDDDDDDESIEWVPTPNKTQYSATTSPINRDYDHSVFSRTNISYDAPMEISTTHSYQLDDAPDSQTSKCNDEQVKKNVSSNLFDTNIEEVDNWRDNEQISLRNALSSIGGDDVDESDSEQSELIDQLSASVDSFERVQYTENTSVIARESLMSLNEINSINYRFRFNPPHDLLPSRSTGVETNVDAYGVLLESDLLNRESEENESQDHLSEPGSHVDLSQLVKLLPKGVKESINESSFHDMDDSPFEMDQSDIPPHGDALDVDRNGEVECKQEGISSLETINSPHSVENSFGEFEGIGYYHFINSPMKARAHLQTRRTSEGSSQKQKHLWLQKCKRDSLSAFRQSDKNNKGYLTFDEFCRFLEVSGFFPSEEQHPSKESSRKPLIVDDESFFSRGVKPHVTNSVLMRKSQHSKRHSHLPIKQKAFVLAKACGEEESLRAVGKNCFEDLSYQNLVYHEQVESLSVKDVTMFMLAVTGSKHFRDKSIDRLVVELRSRRRMFKKQQVSSSRSMGGAGSSVLRSSQQQQQHSSRLFSPSKSHKTSIASCSSFFSERGAEFGLSGEEAREVYRERRWNKLLQEVKRKDEQELTFRPKICKPPEQPPPPPPPQRDTSDNSNFESKPSAQQPPQLAMKTCYGGASKLDKERLQRTKTKSSEELELEEHCTFHPQIIAESPFVSERTLASITKRANAAAPPPPPPPRSGFAKCGQSLQEAKENEIMTIPLDTSLSIYYYDIHACPPLALPVVIPDAPPLPGSAWVVLTQSDSERAQRNKVVIKKKTAAEKEALASAKPAFSSLVEELNFKLKGLGTEESLIRLRPPPNKLKMKRKKSKAKKQEGFDNVMDEMKFMLAQLNKLADGEVVESSSESEDEVLPSGREAKQSEAVVEEVPKGSVNNVLKAMLNKPKGDHEEDKDKDHPKLNPSELRVAVEVNRFNIPRAPPLPGMPTWSEPIRYEVPADDYSNNPPPPLHISQAESTDARPAGYYLPAPDYVQIEPGKIKFAAKVGEHEGIDYLVQARIHKLQEQEFRKERRMSLACRVVKAVNELKGGGGFRTGDFVITPKDIDEVKEREFANDEVTVISQALKNRKTPQDLPIPSHYYEDINKKLKEKKMRSKEDLCKWKQGMRNYDEKETKEKNSKYLDEVTKPKAFSLSTSARQKNKVISFRPKVSTASEKLSITEYVDENSGFLNHSNSGVGDLGTALWTGNLRNHSSKQKGLASDAHTVSTRSIGLLQSDHDNGHKRHSRNAGRARPPSLHYSIRSEQKAIRKLRRAEEENELKMMEELKQKRKKEQLYASAKRVMESIQSKKVATGTGKTVPERSSSFARSLSKAGIHYDAASLVPPHLQEQQSLNEGNNDDKTVCSFASRKSFSSSKRSISDYLSDSETEKEDYVYHNLNVDVDLSSYCDDSVCEDYYDSDCISIQSKYSIHRSSDIACRGDETPLQAVVSRKKLAAESISAPSAAKSYGKSRAKRGHALSSPRADARSSSPDAVSKAQEFVSNRVRQRELASKKEREHVMRQRYRRIKRKSSEKLRMQQQHHEHQSFEAKLAEETGSTEIDAYGYSNDPELERARREAGIIGKKSSLRMFFEELEESSEEDKVEPQYSNERDFSNVFHDQRQDQGEAEGDCLQNTLAKTENDTLMEVAKDSTDITESNIQNTASAISPVRRASILFSHIDFASESALRRAASLESTKDIGDNTGCNELTHSNDESNCELGDNIEQNEQTNQEVPQKNEILENVKRMANASRDRNHIVPDMAHSVREIAVVRRSLKATDFGTLNYDAPQLEAPLHSSTTENEYNTAHHHSGASAIDAQTSQDIPNHAEEQKSEVTTGLIDQSSCYGQDVISSMTQSQPAQPQYHQIVHVDENRTGSGDEVMIDVDARLGSGVRSPRSRSQTDPPQLAAESTPSIGRRRSLAAGLDRSRRSVSVDFDGQGEEVEAMAGGRGVAMEPFQHYPQQQPQQPQQQQQQGMVHEDESRTGSGDEVVVDVDARFGSGVRSPRSRSQTDPPQLAAESTPSIGRRRSLAAGLHRSRRSVSVDFDGQEEEVEAMAGGRGVAMEPFQHYPQQQPLQQQQQGMVHEDESRTGSGDEVVVDVDARFGSGVRSPRSRSQTDPPQLAAESTPSIGRRRSLAAGLHRSRRSVSVDFDGQEEEVEAMAGGRGVAMEPFQHYPQQQQQQQQQQGMVHEDESRTGSGDEVVVDVDARFGSGVRSPRSRSQTDPPQLAAESTPSIGRRRSLAAGLDRSRRSVSVDFDGQGEEVEAMAGGRGVAMEPFQHYPQQQPQQPQQQQQQGMVHEDESRTGSGDEVVVDVDARFGSGVRSPRSRSQTDPPQLAAESTPSIGRRRSLAAGLHRSRRSVSVDFDGQEEEVEAMAGGRGVAMEPFQHYPQQQPQQQQQQGMVHEDESRTGSGDEVVVDVDARFGSGVRSPRSRSQTDPPQLAAESTPSIGRRRSLAAGLHRSRRSVSVDFDGQEEEVEAMAGGRGVAMEPFQHYPQQQQQQQQGMVHEDESRTGSGDEVVVDVDARFGSGVRSPRSRSQTDPPQLAAESTPSIGRRRSLAAGLHRSRRSVSVDFDGQEEEVEAMAGGRGVAMEPFQHYPQQQQGMVHEDEGEISVSSQSSSSYEKVLIGQMKKMRHVGRQSLVITGYSRTDEHNAHSHNLSSHNQTFDDTFRNNGSGIAVDKSDSDSCNSKPSLESSSRCSNASNNSWNSLVLEKRCGLRQIPKNRQRPSYVSIDAQTAALQSQGLHIEGGLGSLNEMNEEGQEYDDNESDGQLDSVSTLSNAIDLL